LAKTSLRIRSGFWLRDRASFPSDFQCLNISSICQRNRAETTTSSIESNSPEAFVTYTFQSHSASFRAEGV
jgi:hypothetical protein